MELISKATRRAFEQHLVENGVLRQIHELFDDAGIPQAAIPADRLPGGQRRALITQYYASVDWTSTADVRKVLRVFERILCGAAPGPFAQEPSDAFQKLTSTLLRDGFAFEGTGADGHIVSRTGVDLAHVAAATDLVDRATLRDQIRRIEQSIEADPGQAIGSAKELAETAAKHVLEQYDEDPDAYDTFPRLIKAAIGKLDLSSEPLAEAKKGSTALAMLIGGLGQIAEGTATLRNLYGTGHGRTRRDGAEGRHARLVVGACASLAAFLLETLDQRRSEGR